MLNLHCLWYNFYKIISALAIIKLITFSNALYSIPKFERFHWSAKIFLPYLLHIRLKYIIQKWISTHSVVKYKHWKVPFSEQNSRNPIFFFIVAIRRKNSIIEFHDFIESMKNFYWLFLTISYLMLHTWTNTKCNNIAFGRIVFQMIKFFGCV